MRIRLLSQRGHVIGHGLMLRLVVMLLRRGWLVAMLRLSTSLLRMGLQNRIDLAPPVFRCVLLESFKGQKLWFGTHLFMAPMDMRLRNCGMPIDAICAF